MPSSCVSTHDQIRKPAMDEIEPRGAGDGPTGKQMNADEEAARRGDGDGATGRRVKTL